MHAPRARFSVLLVVACFFATSGTMAALQTDTAVVPDPAECQVEPRDAASLAAIAGTPEPASTASSEADLPQGPPADADTVAALIAAERELIACFNAGDFARLLALLTDRAVLLVTGGTPNEETIATILAQATPEAIEARTSLIRLRDVRILGPGRVGAIIEWGEASDPTVVTEIIFHVFARIGSRWLLDDAIVNLPLPTAPASPAASGQWAGKTTAPTAPR